MSLWSGSEEEEEEEEESTGKGSLSLDQRRIGQVGCPRKGEGVV
jgi:hypothetical protein